jgi:HK97 family phage major capsid protein
MADNMKELNDTLKQVSQDLTRVSDDLTRKSEDALKQVKDLGDLTQSTKGEVDKLITQQTDLTGKLDGIVAQIAEIEQKSARRAAPEPAISVGQQVVDHEQIKALNSSVQAGLSINVPVKNAAMLTTDLGDDTADLIVPTRIPGIQQNPRQRLFIRDLIGVGRTTSNAIFWVQQTGFTNAAAVVAEGAKKPESAIAFDTKVTPVVTIAHLFKASKQILDDFAQLQSLVDAEMRYGLSYVEEQEILFGAGGAGNIEGIVPQATAFAPAFEPTDRTNIDDLRLAILQAQLARLPVTGFVLHMMDWAKIELTKDANGGYILANPQGLLGPNLWGLPVVPTEVPEFEGNFLAGAFGTGAPFFVR